mmetsp:Transcript_49856/g.133468  ORF Transcript_49856/g.133468 Transcript_49856/m.133468 type:complete len:252 (+) Transcript_49856:236-991(+)
MVPISAAAIAARSRFSPHCTTTEDCLRDAFRRSSVRMTHRRSDSRLCCIASIRCSSERFCVWSSWLHLRSARCSATICSIDFLRSSDSCCSRPWTRTLSTAATGLGTPRLFRSVRRDSSSAPLRRCLSRANSICRVKSSSAAMPSLSIIWALPCARPSVSLSAASLAVCSFLDDASSVSSCLSKFVILELDADCCWARVAFASSKAASLRATSLSSRWIFALLAAASLRREDSASRRWLSRSSALERCASA